MDLFIVNSAIFFIGFGIVSYILFCVISKAVKKGMLEALEEWRNRQWTSRKAWLEKRILVQKQGWHFENVNLVFVSTEINE